MTPLVPVDRSFASGSSHKVKDVHVMSLLVRSLEVHRPQKRSNSTRSLEMQACIPDDAL